MAETTESTVARLRGRMAVTVSTDGTTEGFFCERADILAVLDAYEAEHARAKRLAATLREIEHAAAEHVEYLNKQYSAKVSDTIFALTVRDGARVALAAPEKGGEPWVS